MSAPRDASQIHTIAALLHNIHHILNLLRPVQARKQTACAFSRFSAMFAAARLEILIMNARRFPQAKATLADILQQQADEKRKARLSPRATQQVDVLCSSLITTRQMSKAPFSHKSLLFVPADDRGVATHSTGSGRSLAAGAGGTAGLGALPFAPAARPVNSLRQDARDALHHCSLSYSVAGD